MLSMIVIAANVLSFLHGPLVKSATCDFTSSQCSGVSHQSVQSRWRMQPRSICKAAAASPEDADQPDSAMPRVLSFEPPLGRGDVEAGAVLLREWLRGCGDKGVVVISGAGLSTGATVKVHSTSACVLTGL